MVFFLQKRPALKRADRLFPLLLRLADGQATKIIIPSEIQGLAGLASGLVETAKEAK